MALTGGARSARSAWSLRDSVTARRRRNGRGLPNDTRLNRVVAIKVLHGHMATDLQLRERFDREAKAISSLNHPHICALYDVGSQNGIDFLVMEYLDGETLADRIARDRLSVAESLHSDRR